MAFEARRKESAPQPHRAVLAPELMARVRQIPIRTHRMVSAALSGAYRSTFRGQGIEFEEVRAYQPGDDSRAIDWNVTARTGEPFIKSYREERQLTLQFLVDTSASMHFGSGERTKRDAAAELVALLCFVASEHQDQIGLCLFDDTVHLRLPPRKESKHVLRCVREVLAAPARGRAGNLREAVRHQSGVFRRRSMIFVVSDFLGLPGTSEQEEWEDQLRKLSIRHDVIAVRFFDPFEEELPEAGIVPLQHVETGELVELDLGSAEVRKAWHDSAVRRRAAIRSSLARAQVDLLEVSTRESVADPIARFFRRRTVRGARR